MGDRSTPKSGTDRLFTPVLLPLHFYTSTFWRSNDPYLKQWRLKNTRPRPTTNFPWENVFYKPPQKPMGLPERVGVGVVSVEGPSTEAKWPPDMESENDNLEGVGRSSKFVSTLSVSVRTWVTLTFLERKGLHREMSERLIKQWQIWRTSSPSVIRRKRVDVGVPLATRNHTSLPSAKRPRHPGPESVLLSVVRLGDNSLGNA